MKNLVNKYALLRKSLAIIHQIPRCMKRITVTSLQYRNSPPVLVNSFPKSGTHLLLQIVEALPELKNYSTFIASMPSIPFRERSNKKHLRLIHRIVPGEVLPAHLFYHQDYSDALDDINSVHFFIYRDPRDVIVSDVHYLTEMNHWHCMHKYFISIDSWEERISRAILGFTQPDFPFDYPNIAERFSRYRGWLEKSEVCSVCYEDLISSQLHKHLRRIASFYIARCEIDCSIDDVVVSMEANISPEESPTFRQGNSGEWRKVFTERHKVQMKTVAGKLLIDLGYEQSLEW